MAKINKTTTVAKTAAPDVAKVATTSTVETITEGTVWRKKRAAKEIGLSPSQFDDAVRKGLIPRGFPIIEGGRALGWLALTMIAHIKNRAAAALAAGAKKQAEGKR